MESFKLYISVGHKNPMDDLKNYELSDLFDLRGTYQRRILSVKNINGFCTTSVGLSVSKGYICLATSSA